MFCDLVGSTALSTRFDPEDMQEIVGVYHRCCADLIVKAGGFVARYMGDGVLVYFGYPQAHEHDAERAVRAGLALVSGEKLDLRRRRGRWRHSAARAGSIARKPTSRAFRRASRARSCGGTHGRRAHGLRPAALTQLVNELSEHPR
jgi:class 3 adenylate cyclase